MKRLAIITTHPIQYNAPLFSLLANRANIEIKVFYTWGEEVLQDKYDPGFGKKVEWDIPLLEGYEYEFVNNVAKDPGSHHFKGIDNPGLISAIENWGANAVLVYGWSFKSHLKAMRFFYKKIPVFFRGDSIILDKQSPIKSGLRNVFLRWVYSHINFAFYVGTNNKNYFKNAGLGDEQLIFAPHAIDNQRFSEDAERNKEESMKWRRTLGVMDNEIVFLYAGKLIKNKNILFLLNAFITAHIENTHLLIAGNGSEEKSLKEQFTKYPEIRFLPFQNQQTMPILYKMADVFVLPSFAAETWGLGINEAMACGKAILASDACGAAIDLVKPGVNGYIFERDDAADAVVKIKLMNANPEKLISFGKASEKIIADWNFEKICISIENAVLQIFE